MLIERCVASARNTQALSTRRNRASFGSRLGHLLPKQTLNLLVLCKGLLHNLETLTRRIRVARRQPTYHTERAVDAPTRRGLDPHTRCAPCVSAPTLRLHCWTSATASSGVSSAELAPCTSSFSSSWRHCSRYVSGCWLSQAERRMRRSPRCSTFTKRSSSRERTCNMGAEADGD